MKRRPLNAEEQADAERLAAAWRAYKNAHKGVTQAWLASVTGLGTQGAIGQYLQSVIPLNLTALVSICKILDVAPSAISPKLSTWLDNTGVGNVSLPPLTLSGSASAGGAGDKDAASEEYVPGPRYEREAAGSGSVEKPSYATASHETYSRTWLEQNNLNRSTLAVVFAPDDSMAKRIRQGDMLLIDTADTTIADDAVYALGRDKLRVKRLFIRYDGQIIIRSDNQEFPEEVAPVEALHIVGRVVGLTGTKF